MRRRLSLVPTLLAGCALHGLATAAAAADQPPLPQTVVVSATRHAMALIDAPAAMTVVTPAQIAERGADNLFEALRGEPGLSPIGRTISGRRNLSIRGLDGRHTLFLIDGMRLGGTDGVVGHSDFQYDWVPVQDIARIEVLRGPMSVLYGAEALGGVVNVITRAPGERWVLGTLVEGSVAEGGLGGDGHRAALSASGPLSDHWRLGVTASDSWRDQITNTAEPRLGDLEGHHKRDGVLRLAWLPAAGHQVDLQHRVGDEDRWAGVRERSGQRRWHVSMHEIQRSHTSLGWQADWGGRADGSWQARSQLRAYASQVEVRNTRTLGVAALRPQTLDDQVVEGQTSVAPSAGKLLTAGFEWRDEQLDNVGLAGGHGQVRHRALFGQAEWAPLASLALTAGLRHDHHGRFGSQWSPRAYAVWKPAGQWVLKAGIGHGFKAPTLKQISPDYREDEGPYTYFGNPALQPERNRALEAGVGWQGAQAGVQALLFHNRVTNLIVPRLTGSVAGRAQYQFHNIDRARLQGLELEARQRLAGGWQIDANYTCLDATDGNGTRLEKRPRHLLGLQLAWSGGPWLASVRADHHAGQLIAPVVVGQPLQALPDLTRLSAQLSRQLTPALRLSLGVDNLGNLRLADESPLFTWAEAPRTWRVALRGQF